MPICRGIPGVKWSKCEKADRYCPRGFPTGYLTSVKGPSVWGDILSVRCTYMYVSSVFCWSNFLKIHFFIKTLLGFYLRKGEKLLTYYFYSHEESIKNALKLYISQYCLEKNGFILNMTQINLLWVPSQINLVTLLLLNQTSDNYFVKYLLQVFVVLSKKKKSIFW